MKAEDLVTIVVPVYNVQAYLQRCLESIAAQTYRNIEVLLIDDGSTDGSSLMCDKASFADDRFMSIHKMNGGLSDARNAGLDAAKGTWIFFLDSDDYISPYCIEAMVDVAAKSNAEIVECWFETVDDAAKLKWRRPSGTYRAYKQPTALERFLDYDGTWIMAWNKLYRKDLFEGIRFPVGKLNEDEFTTPLLVERANTYASLNDSLYAYVQREGSIMHSPFSSRKLDGLEALLGRLEHFSELGSKRIDALNAYHLLARCRCLEEEYQGELGHSRCSIVAAANRALQVKPTPREGWVLFGKSMLLRHFPELMQRMKGNLR